MIQSKNLLPFIIPASLVLSLFALAYPISLYFLLSAVGIVVAVGISRDIHYTLLCIPLAIAILISLHFQHQYQHHREWLAQYHAKRIDIEGTIIDLQSTNNPHMPQQLIIQSNRIDKQPCTKIFAVHTTRLDALPGDDITARNLRVKIPSNHDYDFYLFKEGIQTSFFAKNDVITVKPAKHYSYAAYINQKKHTLMESFKKSMNKETFSWFASLFLGNKGTDLHATRINFQYWGISHFLARSGMHLVIFIMIISALLRLLPVAYHAKKTMSLALCILYIALTFSSISMYRAFFTLIAYTLLQYSNRQIHPLHTLATITLLVIAHNPAQAFFLDFQLSFGITFILLWHSFLRQAHKAQQLLSLAPMQANP